jgi:hypothetical protein
LTDIFGAVFFCLHPQPVAFLGEVRRSGDAKLSSPDQESDFSADANWLAGICAKGELCPLAVDLEGGIHLSGPRTYSARLANSRASSSIPT